MGEKIWKYIERSSVILGMLLIIIGAIKGLWADDIKLFLENLTLDRVILYIIIILAILVYFSFITRRLTYGIPRSWKLKLGVYWDEQMNAYCAVHKIPLSRPGSDYQAFYCSKCKENIYLHHVPRQYTLDQAIEKIREGKI